MSVLACNLGEELLLLFRRELVEALDSGDDVEAFEGRPKAVFGLKPRVRAIERFGSRDSDIADIDAGHRMRVTKNCLCEVTFTTSQL